MSRHRYLHLDVFTDRPFAGNQLAVFPDARGMSSELMQNLTAELNYSESTFVLPAEDPDLDAKVRIFTPKAEIPMAGHPTIGTTFALVQEGRIDAGRGAIRLELGIGPTPVDLAWDGADLRFAWMTQPVAELGATLGDLPELAACLGVEMSDLQEGGPPPQPASSGIPFLYVGMASRAAVDRALLDRSRLQRYCAAQGLDELPVYLFSLEEGGATDLYSRMFAPGFGIAEDPATGGACGPLGCYLAHHGAVSAERAARLTNLQGAAMGRPSQIHISVRRDGQTIQQVRVGGRATAVGEGWIEA